ncbi:MAG: hypothetical protein M3R24_10905 [Chloroflexota bacterium]|nr:hypothetical protein [Chloroflexota bacterium]PLS79947.1 MAG: hypothetical protein CYG59_10570 [Chloroflexota bacterium]
MARTVIIHIVGEDPVLGEMEHEPQPSDTFIQVSNLRKRDGKDVHYLSPGVQTVAFPWTRITFLEFMVDEEERGKVIDFFRLD